MDLKERVEQSGIRHKKLAELLDVSKVMLSHWLSGTRPMPDDKKKRLIEVLERVEKILG
jgi:predicted transcriptional regulator